MPEISFRSMILGAGSRHMPRFVFTMMLNGHEDHVELDLPDIGTAKQESARAVSELLYDRNDGIWAHGRVAVLVKDEEGRQLLTMQVVAAEQQL